MLPLRADGATEGGAHAVRCGDVADDRSEAQIGGLVRCGLQGRGSSQKPTGRTRAVVSRCLGLVNMTRLTRSGRDFPARSRQ